MESMYVISHAHMTSAAPSAAPLSQRPWAYGGFAPHTRRGALCMGTCDRSRPCCIGCVIDTCRYRQGQGKMPLLVGADKLWLRSDA